MAWCPRCKNEYVEGVTVCADCGCALVDSPEEAGEPIIFGSREQMERLKAFLEYNHISPVYMKENEEDRVCELAVDDSRRKEAGKIIRIFLEQEEAEGTGTAQETGSGGEEGSPDSAGECRPKSAGIYQDSAERAEENRSSAYLLIGVGSAGLIAVILIFFDVIPLNLNPLNKYMLCGVMGVLFLLFVIMGILSMKTSRVLAVKAKSEDGLAEQIHRWCIENMDGEELDRELFTDHVAEEAKYFPRTEKMKELIGGKFMNLDESFLEHLVDEYYQEIFPGERETDGGMK